MLTLSRPDGCQDIGPDRTRIAIATFSGDRSINPNRTQWPNETDCPVGTQWIQPPQYPQSVAQVGYPSSACACEGGVTCTPSSNQTTCTNLGVQDAGLPVVAWRNSGTTRGSCGTTGGTGTFHDGLPNGVREDLLFSSGNSLDTVLSTIDSNMVLPGGFTWTSAGLELVRTRLFSTATGMRSSAVAVPRVLIVLTDGQATCTSTFVCFQPAQAARALRDDGITVLAVGVGSAIGQAQLESIAGTRQNVFQVTQYSQLPDISNRVDGQSCSACVSLPFELPSTIQISTNEYRCVRVCGVSQSVVVSVESGTVDIYISNSQYGGPRNNTASVVGIQAGS